MWDREVNWEVGRRAFRSQVPASQQQGWRPLTVGEIRDALYLQRGKAAGADHCSGNEVAGLPEEVLRFVTEFYALCVRVGKSPKVWKNAGQIHLPKEGLKGRDLAPVEKLRPITVLSPWYRAWGAAVLQTEQSQEWVESWWPPEARGVRKASVCTTHWSLWMLRALMRSFSSFLISALHSTPFIPS